MVIFRDSAMHAQHLYLRRKLSIAGRYQTPVAKAAEGFAGKKGKATDGTDRPGKLRFTGDRSPRAAGLGDIFDDPQVVLLGQRREFLHSAALTEEVNRQQRF